MSAGQFLFLPSAVVAVREHNQIALLEAQLVVVGAFEGELSLHNCVVHVCRKRIKLSAKNLQNEFVVELKCLHENVKNISIRRSSSAEREKLAHN